MKIEFNEKQPIYIQIQEMLKKEIAANEIKCGEKLPSVRELSIEFKVNPNTVQRAYMELENEGVTFTKRGMGTFVTEDEDKVLILKRYMARDIINIFIREMKQLGFKDDEITNLLSEKLKGDNK